MRRDCGGVWRCLVSLIGNGGYCFHALAPRRRGRRCAARLPTHTLSYHLIIQPSFSLTRRRRPCLRLPFFAGTASRLLPRVVSVLVLDSIALLLRCLRFRGRCRIIIDADCLWSDGLRLGRVEGGETLAVCLAWGVHNPWLRLPARIGLGSQYLHPVLTNNVL